MRHRRHRWHCERCGCFRGDDHPAECEGDDPRARIVRIVIRNVEGELTGGAGRLTFDPFDSDALRQAVSDFFARGGPKGTGSGTP
jgi:hypothetical protein